MTDREAMKMALDYIKDIRDHCACEGIDCENENALVAKLEAALAQPEQDDGDYSYAKCLAGHIWWKHYKERFPDWKPLDTTLGVLTQIDEMTCWLVLPETLRTAPPSKEQA